MEETGEKCPLETLSLYQASEAAAVRQHRGQLSPGAHCSLGRGCNDSGAEQPLLRPPATLFNYATISDLYILIRESGNGAVLLLPVQASPFSPHLRKGLGR